MFVLKFTEMATMTTKSVVRQQQCKVVVAYSLSFLQYVTRNTEIYHPVRMWC